MVNSDKADHQCKGVPSAYGTIKLLELKCDSSSGVGTGQLEYLSFFTHFKYSS